MNTCANAKVLPGQPADQGSSALAPEFIRPAPISSEELLRGRRLLEIAHNGEVYRLQATRLGKLILTK
jgi:hemin uptake protein HemP